jgi:hypothetical protein
MEGIRNTYKWLQGPRKRDRLGDLDVDEKTMKYMFQKYILRTLIGNLPHDKVSGTVFKSRW